MPDSKASRTAPPEGANSSSERTPLLSKKSPGTSTITALPAQADVLPDEESIVNVERVNQPDNRQYEGLPEVVKTLKWAFPALLLGALLCSLDQTLVATSWSKIGSELHALNSTSWIATAYSATVVACHPLYGRLSDIYGRKPCILTAYCLFAIGTALCGSARSIQELAAARAIAGAGGGGMNSLVSMILADAVPLRDRPSWQIYINMAWFVGASVGGPIGGLLADSVGWRWSFWGQVPIVVLALTLVSVTLKLPRKENDIEPEQSSRLARVDFLGSFLLVLTITAFLLMLDFGSDKSWSATETLISAAAFVPLFFAFVFVELRVARHPVMPFKVVFTRGTISVHLAGFSGMAAFSTVNMFGSLYLIAVKRRSTTEASLAMVPRAVGALVGSTFTAQWIKRRGTYWRLGMTTWSGTLLCNVGLLAVARTAFDSEIAFIVFLSVGSMFSGAASATTNTALVANSTYEDQAVNLGAMYFFRAIGSVWGVSVAATVVNTLLRICLAADLPDKGHVDHGIPDADDIADLVRKNLGFVDSLPAELAAIVTTCYARAIAGSLVFNCSMVLLSGAALWFIIEKPLGKP